MADYLIRSFGLTGWWQREWSVWDRTTLSLFLRGQSVLLRPASAPLGPILLRCLARVLVSKRPSAPTLTLYAWSGLRRGLT